MIKYVHENGVCNMYLDGVLLGTYDNSPSPLLNLNSSIISGLGTDAVSLAMIDEITYGVSWDATVSSSTCTRIGNKLYHGTLPIQSLFRGCVALGKDILYYLDANDWNYKDDGTEARLDGYDGVVKIHTPKFYGLSGSNGNTRWVRISLYKWHPSCTEIPEMLIDAFLPTVLRSVPTDFGYMSKLPLYSLVSICNTASWCRGGNNSTTYDSYVTSSNEDEGSWRTNLGKPATSLTRPTFNNYAALSGGELIPYDIYKWIFCWCYVIEYANFNSLAAYNAEPTSLGYKLGGLGSGLTTWDGTNWSNYNGYNPVCPNGYMNEYGNFSGVKAAPTLTYTKSDGTVVTKSGMYACKWRGFENPFGNIWCFVDGIIFKRDTANTSQRAYIFNSGHYTATSNPTTAMIDESNCRIVTGLAASEGWQKDWILDEVGDILPSTVGASSTYRPGDYYWCNVSSTGYRLLVVGGGLDHGATAGLFAFHSYHVLGYSGTYVGALGITKLG